MKSVPLNAVFHPSDFTQGDQPALAHALKLALVAKAELTILHVDEPEIEVSWTDFPSIRETLSNWGLGPAQHQTVLQTGIRVKKVKKAGHDTARAVVDYVAEHHPNLIVLATHQRDGLGRWLHGAIAEPIARNAQVMTLFVPRQTTGFVSRDKGEVSLRNVLIPIAPSPIPQRAIDAATTLVALLSPPQTCFHLLYVGAEEDFPAVSLPERPGWNVERSTWQGNVVEHVLQTAEARNADLIVMTTRGHQGFLDALRGSTTERVLRAAPCPLLAVPAA